MGILSALGLRQPGDVSSPSRSAGRSARRIVSPWSSSALQSIAFADIFGKDFQPVTRGQAMRVPAVAKARHLVCGLARQPLRAYQGDRLLSEQPRWLSRTDGEVAPRIRMLWTLDDLFFGGWSLWALDRPGARIDDATRVPPEWWTFDPDGRVLVHDQPIESGSHVLFSGPYEGLLEAGAGTIRAALNLEAAWAQRVQSPIPLVNIKQDLSDDELGDPTDEDDDDELDFGQAMVDAYVTARRDPNGAVMFTPHGYSVEALGDVRHELFVEGRNAVTLDVARFCSIPANLLDASLSTASLTYTNTQSSRSDFRDMTADFWLTPIEDRLSMDDVTTPRTRIAFDLSNLAQVPGTGLAPATED